MHNCIMTVRTESLQRSEPAENIAGRASVYLGRRAERERWCIAVVVV